MKPRLVKYVALCLSGGMLLQIGGCFVTDLLAQIVFTNVLRGLLQLLAGGAPA